MPFCGKTVRLRKGYECRSLRGSSWCFVVLLDEEQKEEESQVSKTYE